MGLMNCPDCRREISTQAPTCPNCGRAFATSRRSDVRASSGVMDGVRLGCGMFIVLPILILLAFIVFMLVICANPGTY